MCLVTTSPATTPEEMDLKQAESVASEGVAVASIGQQESEPKLAAHDWEEGCIKKSATEEELTQPLLPAASSCTSDTVLDICDESAGHSESLQVGDPFPDLEVLSDHPTEEENLNQDEPSHC